MQALCAMGSFSDAHETVEIPIIAAGLQQLILPRQCQVWAVLITTDSLQRIAYLFAATLLGKMCISGNTHDLAPEQLSTLNEVQRLYTAAVPVTRGGKSRIQRSLNNAWRTPRGWRQSCARASANTPTPFRWCYTRLPRLQITSPSDCRRGDGAQRTPSMCPLTCGSRTVP